ncbi:hypothetical protein R3P38DRAFT_3290535 [Favolaschia claudopus]|uniref:F-box domain-containing protein n=1 Tax=Favolaschia claudopus TaxID=2862362 RepID=A0AAV9ZSC4_9AGAR
MSELSLSTVNDLIVLAENRLSALTPEYDDVEEEIFILHMQLVRAERKANRLSAAIDECNSQITTLTSYPTKFSRAPVRRLPPELICEVFQWLVLDGYTRRVNKWEVPIAPWKLTHVCRAWREIARGCVRLWTTIDVTVREDTPQDNYDAYTGTWSRRYYDEATEEYVERYYDARESLSSCLPQEALNAQLQLSQLAGLNIEFNIEDSEQAINLCDTLGTLIEESNRWSRFTLSWAGCPDILSLLSKIEGRLGQLEYLKLDPQQTDGDYWSSQFTNIFALAPCLRELNVTTFHLDDYRSALSLPKHRLTRANSLIDAVLRLDKSDEASPDAALELPYLKQLSLNNDWDLTLSGHIGNILSILNRSQCQLQTLGLDTCDIQPDILHSVLRPVAPVLYHLRVDFGFKFGYDGREDLVRVILQTLMSLDNFQRLACLELDVSYIESSLRDELHTMLCDGLESRWNLPKDIRSLIRVRLHPDDAFPDAIRTRIERLRAEGLDVNRLKLEKRTNNIFDDWF